MSNEANGRNPCLQGGNDGMESRPAQEEARLCIRRLEAVCAFCREITSESDLPALLGLIPRRSCELLGADSAALWVYDEQAETLSPSVWPPDDRWPQDLRLRLGEGVAGTAAARREGLTVNCYRTSPWALPFFLDHTRVSALMAEPLLSGDRLLGVIALGTDDPAQVFTSDDRRALALLAPHAAIALEDARLQTATLRRWNESQALLQGARGLMGTLELPGVLSPLVAEAARMTGSSVAVYVLNAEEGALELGAQSEEGLLSAGPCCPIGSGLSGLVAERCAPIFSPDVTADPRNPTRARDKRLGFRTYLGLPLMIRNALVGVLALYTREARAYTAEQLAYLGSFAGQAALGIENARLHAEAARQQREAELFADLTTQLNASLDLDTVLSQVAAAARELCAADLAQLALRDADSGALVFRYLAGTRYEDYDQVRIEPGKGVGGRVLVSGEPFRTANYAGDTRITKDYLERMLAEGMVAVLAVPIKSADLPEGVLYAYNRTSRPFSDRDEATLLRLAAQAAVAIKNAQLYQELRTHRDTLRSLSAKIVTVREEEAKRMARELHDEVGQTLTSVLLGLQGLQTLDDAAEVGGRAREIAGLVKASLEEVHRIVQALRPTALDHAGLVPALERHIQVQAAATGLRIDFCAPGVEGLPLPDEVASTLFRIVQEALTNVAKHADARSVTVMLARRGSRLALTVEDDGRGFDPTELRRVGGADPGLGLVGIEERTQHLGGELKVQSARGNGTTLVVEIPLSSMEGESR